MSISTPVLSGGGTFQMLPVWHRGPGTKVAAGPRGGEQHITPTWSVLVSVVGSHLAATSPRLAFN